MPTCHSCRGRIGGIRWHGCSLLPLVYPAYLQFAVLSRGFSGGGVPHKAAVGETASHRTQFPQDLPPEAGATHTGIFIAWAMLSGLAGELHLIDIGLR